MLNYVQQMDQKPLKFALYEEFFSITSVYWAIFKSEFLEPDLQKSLNGIKESPMTCLECAYKIALKSGIIFQPDNLLKKSIEKIESLKSAPILLMPNGFDQYFGKSLFEVSRELNEQILAACVILTSPDSSPDQCEKWAWQTTLEETAATDREIARVETSGLTEVWSGYTPKRW